MGLGTGMGYDIRIGRNVSLTPAVSFVRGFVRDTSTVSPVSPQVDPKHNVLDVTLGVTVH